MTTVLLTGAGGSATANVLHALRLAATRYRIVGADVSPIKLHLSEADDRLLLPAAASSGYVDSLAAAIEYAGAQVVHVQPDPEVLVVGAARDRLPAATFLPSQEALELASDKSAFASRMAAADVPVPESAELGATYDEMRSRIDDLLLRHERVWVRARRGAGSRASLPVRTARQAVHWVDWWCAERGFAIEDFMAAEMLPGREFAYQSVWQHGQLVVGQTRERVEYLYGFLTPSGQTSTPAVARTVDEPKVDALAQRAITALDASPHGIYCVDVKCDISGRPKVTEVNAGRFFTTSNFFAVAGLNMPDMAVRAALGEQLSPIGSSPLAPDLYWIRMVDMSYKLVSGDELDCWRRFG